MIASIFKNSRPINFVVVLTIVFIMFVYANIWLLNEPFSFALVVKEIFVFGISVFSVFLLNFIVVKNKLTDQSSYHVLIYSLFLSLFPHTLINVDLLLSNVFVLLAFRRLISMRSQIHIKKKVFDAAFWIAIAALFYFWSILFFVLIYVALLLYSDNRIKNWIIPLTGLATVLVLLITYHLMRYNSLDILLNNLPNINFDYSNYNSVKRITALTVLISFGLWSTFFYIKNLKDKLRESKPSDKIVVAFAVVAFVVALLSEIKNSSEFIFMFAPFSIIMANYIDSIKEKWFKEVFLWSFTLIPFLLLIL